MCMCARSIVVGLLLAVLLPGASQAQEVDWALKVGQELDSNPGRITGAGSDADTATRLMATADAAGQASRSVRWDAAGVLATRWFARASDNDSVVADARGGVSWQATPHLMWRTSLGARDTVERRNGRDFTMLDASTGLRIGTIALGVRPFMGVQSFVYKPDREFRWLGPRAGGSLDGRVGRQYRWSAGVDHARRRFERRLVGDAGAVRVDNVTALRLGSSLTWGRGRLDLRYSAQWSLSNEEGKSLLRHTLTPAITMLPVGDLLVRVSGSLQRARCTGSCQLDEFARADEETRNRFGVALEHPVWSEILWVEARYTYFSQAFEGDGTAAFSRHLGLFGVSVRGASGPD